MSKCSCLTCAFEALIESRYPNGVDADAAIEIGVAAADLVGFTLAPAGDQSLESFILLLKGYRQQHRADKSGRRQVLHS